jgi:hypothetical protein
MKQGQGAMCWSYEGSHMKECPNKGNIFTSKPTSSSIENYEHCDVNGHYNDHDFRTWQMSWTSFGSHVLRLGCRSCGEFDGQATWSWWMSWPSKGGGKVPSVSSSINCIGGNYAHDLKWGECSHKTNKRRIFNL